MKHNKFIIKSMYWKVFLCMFLLSVYGLYQYNSLEVSTFKMEFHQKITKLYDTIRKVTPFYLNTSSVDMKEGIHMIEHVSVMVNESGKIKKLSGGINSLEEEIKLNIKKGFCGITLLQKSASNVNNAYVKPLGDVHIDLNSRYKFDENWINRILENEKMSKNYQAFSQCDLKLTEPYIEMHSSKKMRTIFYPIYVNKSLEAMVLVDLSHTMFVHWLNEFNKKENSFLEYYSGLDKFLIQQETIEIPCTPIDNELKVSINMTLVLFVSAIFSLFMTSIFFVVERSWAHFFNYYSIDQMTGLYRRDFHETKLNRMSGKSVIIIDIDNFKLINDELGHSQGDVVIQEVCRRLQKHVRKNDLAIRWGGEEFVIVLNDISYTGLFSRTEAIRHSICIDSIAGITVSVSIGATTGKALSFKKAFKLADTALYQSKHSGKNRVTVLEEVK